MVPSFIASRPCHEAAKQSKTITLPPPCLIVGMMIFLSNALSFMPDVTRLKPSRNITCPQNIFYRILQSEL